MIYLAFYLVRPLVLFPTSLLTMAAGFVFGPVSGVSLTVLGSNASASIGYLLSDLVNYLAGSLHIRWKSFPWRRLSIATGRSGVCAAQDFLRDELYRRYTKAQPLGA